MATSGWFLTMHVLFEGPRDTRNWCKGFEARGANQIGEEEC